MKNLKMMLLSLALLLPLMSCYPWGFFAAGGAAGIGGYKYYKGGLTVHYKAPYLKVWEATLTALKKMEFEIESAKHGLAHGEIIAKRPDNTPVTINLEYKSAETTKVIIRVGHLGDKEDSLVIKEQIQKILIQ